MSEARRDDAPTGGTALAEPPALDAPPARGVSTWSIAWRQFKRDRVATTSLCGLVLLVLTALLSPLLANSKPVLARYRGGWYFPAFKDYLDENVPIPFGIPGRLQAALPSVFSPSYTGLPRRPGDTAPDWRRLTAEMDARPEPGKDDAGWYLGALVPDYYKETSTAIKQRPGEPVARLEVLDGRAAGEVVEVIPSHEWSEVQTRLRTRDPDLTLSQVVVAWDAEAGRWTAAAVPAASGQPQLAVTLDTGSQGQAALDATPRTLSAGDVIALGQRRLRFTPAPTHVLGTDDTGRDVLSRLIHGAVIACSVGVISVGIYVLIGIVLGALAGYFRGWVDLLISRVIEVVICFPTFFLIITIVALWEHSSIYNIMITLGLISWTGVARLVRGEFLKCMAEEYIQAARALGLSDARIIFRHILPNAMAPVFVSASFGVAGAILVESSLSFLGFGVAPPTASWGEILQQGQHHINENCYHLVWFPGIAIFVVVTAFNLVGEGLRDALDPKLRQ